MTILLVIFAILFGIWFLFKFGINILSFIFEILGSLLSAVVSGIGGGGSDDDSGFGGGESGGGGAEDSF